MAVHDGNPDEGSVCHAEGSQWVGRPIAFRGISG
jgi:hypothetical protein